MINSKSAETGVTASAAFEQTFAIDPRSLKVTPIDLNGTKITWCTTTVAGPC